MQTETDQASQAGSTTQNESVSTDLRAVQTARNGTASGWAYDPDGNETKGKGATTRTAETYSPTNQLTGLTSAGVATTYSYAGLSNTERVAAGTTTYQTGEEGLADQTAAGATTNWTRDPGGTLISQRVGGQSYYYLYDGLGDVTGLVNATGTKIDTYTYTPYGNALKTTETVANPWRFQADYLDTATGLYHDGARYMDPTLARFTQPDPSGQSAGYTYAGDDPVNLQDPSGTSSCGFSLGGLVDCASKFGRAVGGFFEGCGRGLRKISVAALGGFTFFDFGWGLYEGYNTAMAALGLAAAESSPIGWIVTLVLAVVFVGVGCAVGN